MCDYLSRQACTAEIRATKYTYAAILRLSMIEEQPGIMVIYGSIYWVMQGLYHQQLFFAAGLAPSQPPPGLHEAGSRVELIYLACVGVSAFSLTKSDQSGDLSRLLLVYLLIHNSTTY